MPDMKNKSTGFTLVELMVVLAIAVILMSIAAPSFRELVAGQRIKAAASDLAASLIYARSEAIKRNSTVSVVAGADGWASGWTVSSGTVAAAAAATASNTVSSYMGYSDLVFLCFSGGSNVGCNANVIYGANGRVVSGQVFQIGSSAVSSATRRCISIDLSGLPDSKAGPCT